jgi:DNA-binding LacI/PurR family transcriptional regulator
MVNMKDVAEAAGVSQAAVSYAYSRPDKLSAAQARRILQTAHRLGYAGPNVVGASLRSGKVGAIGVMVMDSLSYAFSDPSTTALLQGIAMNDQASGSAVTLIPLPYGTQGETGQQGSGLRGLVDGVIVHSLPDDHPALLVLRARRLPMVTVDAPHLPGVPLVGIRQRDAAEMQATHLLEQGHRRIAVITERLLPDGVHGWVSEERRRLCVEYGVRERLLGYEEAFGKFGADFASVPIYEAGGFAAAAGTRAAQEVLSMRGDITGVITTSDVMAFAVLEVAQTYGRRIPSDLSVIGFDDAPEAYRHGLTTLRQPILKKGEVAANLLFEMMAGRQTELETMLPAELVIRGTTSAPI